MKTRSPLKNRLFAPVMAVAMIFGALTPLAPAQADPLDPDIDVLVEVSQGPDADVEMSQDDETINETPATEAAAEEAFDAGATVEGTPNDVVDEAATPEVKSSQEVISDAVMADQSEAEVIEALERDYDLSSRSRTSAAVPLTAAASAVVEARGLSSMRLKKANGYWVTITPRMQANALVVIDTIKAGKWAGVTASQKNRLIDIALMTMAQESTFYTHPYAHIPDRNQDVGPFQQRSKVGWYADGKTQAENIRILNNIPYATRTFIEGHRVPKRVSGGAGPKGYIIPGVFQMKNWRTDPLWQVAANVQRPARQYRAHYDHWRPVVQQMVKALRGYSSATQYAPDVYNTAGNHTVDGRKWRTTCEAYSKTIDRCTAKIWATTVTGANGKYVQKNGWQFNNLTYLPSSRKQWSGNPLAKTGTFRSKGRSWRTSCADNWTGPKACRSFVQSHVIESYLDGAGNRQFREVKKEVFNNIVRFS